MLKSWFTREKIWFYLLLLVAVLPLFALRDVTRNNELRYLSIVDEALRDGHFFTFYNHGEPYADKPPLYFWFMMLGKALFGHHSMVFLSLFSAIPALVVLWIMDKWTRDSIALNGWRTAAQLMLYTSVFYIGSLVVLRMDMLMCMFIVLALYSFWQLYTNPSRRKHRLSFPLWVFLAVFSKGPVGILVPLVCTLTYLIIQRQWRSIGRFWGWRTWGILLLLSGLWFTGVWLEGGKEYLDNLLFNQTVNRAVDSFHHKEPVWYYTITIWYSLAPWALLIIGAVVYGLIRRPEAKKSVEGFIVTVALTTFVMLSLVSSKIQIYLLPAFPFFVYGGVLAIRRLGERGWMKWCVGVPAFVLMLVFPALFIVRIPVPTGWLFFAGTGLLSLFCMSSLFFLIFRKNLSGGINSLAAGLLLTVFTVSFAVPALNPWIGMRDITQIAERTAREHGYTDIYTYGVARTENLDAYTDHPIRIITQSEELERLHGGVLITWKKRADRDSVMRAATYELQPHVVGEMVYFVLPAR